MNYCHESYPEVMPTGNQELEKVKRRISEVSACLDLENDYSCLNSIDKLDLRQDYQMAVDCIVQCEYIIQTLQERLASKDCIIANLEDRIVQMSLDLASTKAREDQLKHKLRTNAPRAPPLNEVSNVDGGGNSPPSLTVDESMRQGTDLSESNTSRFDDSSSSRLSNFGQFFMSYATRRSSGPSQQGSEGGTMQLHGPKNVESDNQVRRNSKKQWLNGHNNFNDDDDGCQHQLRRPAREQQQKRNRRPPNRKRNELQKSSRSFLESSGVVFPVSSSEVLKGLCLDKSINKGTSVGKNEEWGNLG